MEVIATAGHVDHGKSTLVRALTGMEPDRWAEEQRRGMTIDLGFAWTDLPSGRTVAFVDVPGHERFVPNMLAGVGPAPAVLFVVAADEGWMPQSAEHLAALDALDVRHGLLAVTRADLADPAVATELALEQIERTSLGRVEAVAVSAPTGTGLAELKIALDNLLDHLPEPDLTAPVRLWIDRAFSIRGSGTVVTGTLPAGRIEVGDELELARDGRRVRVRGLQSMDRPLQTVEAVARVAVNLRGVDIDDVRRGDALVTPDRFAAREVIDARLDTDPDDTLPPSLTLHVGSAAVRVQVRGLGADTVRLSLARPLPLRIGDRGLARDPGRHRVLGGLTVLDVAPPSFTRRGDAARRAVVLDGLDGTPDERSELRRRGFVRQDDLARMGVDPTGRPVSGSWLADAQMWASLRSKLVEAVDDWVRTHPLEIGPPLDAVRRLLDLPDLALVPALVDPPLVIRDGRVARVGRESALPVEVAAAVERLRTRLATAPFAAPDASELSALGLGTREIAAAVRAGELLRVADGIVLLPTSMQQASAVLAALAQPFTVSEAKAALHTTRRVAVPLLELLDRQGATRRLADNRREIRAVAPTDA